LKIFKYSNAITFAGTFIQFNGSPERTSLCRMSTRPTSNKTTSSKLGHCGHCSENLAISTPTDLET
jgi:hypothetical protein